jgi:hypothetical protein
MRQYHRITTDVHQLDTNALRYALSMQTTLQRREEEAAADALRDEPGIPHGYGYGYGYESCHGHGDTRRHDREHERRRLDLQSKLEHLRAALDAAEKYHVAMSTVNTAYASVERIVEEILHASERAQQQCLVLGDSCAAPTHTHTHTPIAVQRQRARTVLDDLTREIQTDAYDRSWTASAASSPHIVSRTSAALDARLVQLAESHVQLESDSRTQQCLRSFVDEFFCADGSVRYEAIWYISSSISSSSCPSTSANHHLKTRLVALRSCVASGEAIAVHP